MDFDGMVAEHGCRQLAAVWLHQPSWPPCAWVVPLPLTHGQCSACTPLPSVPPAGIHAPSQALTSSTPGINETMGSVAAFITGKGSLAFPMASKYTSPVTYAQSDPAAVGAVSGQVQW